AGVDADILRFHAVRVDDGTHLCDAPCLAGGDAPRLAELRPRGDLPIEMPAALALHVDGAEPPVFAGNRRAGVVGELALEDEEVVVAVVGAFHFLAPREAQRL